MFGIALEHLHPLAVHFPIALWLTALLFLFFSFIPKFEGLRATSILLGLLGSASGYVAFELGEKAAEIVGSTICNQTLLSEHADQNRTALIILSTVWILCFVYEYLFRKLLKLYNLSLWPTIILFLGSLLGGVFLVSGSHKGFLLTYSEGAAVQGVQRTCKK